MKEMIKKYRGSLISSILVILAGVLVGFTSTHGKWINVFFVVTHCIFVAIIFYDKQKPTTESKSYRNDYMDDTCYYIAL